MNLTKIPFNALIELEIATEDGFLCALRDDVQYTNHLGTVHASALFSLAENSAGYFIGLHLPQFVDKFVPILRKAEVKYLKPALGRILSQAILVNTTFMAIEEMLNQKNRAIFSTEVSLFDSNQNKVFIGIFDWFIAPQNI